MDDLVSRHRQLTAALQQELPLDAQRALMEERARIEQTPGFGDAIRATEQGELSARVNKLAAVSDALNAIPRVYPDDPEARRKTADAENNEPIARRQRVGR